MKLRRSMAIVVLLLCALMLLYDAQASASESVHYFYLNACENCHPYEDFADEFYRITSKNLSDYIYSAYNIFTDTGRHAYEEATAGLSDDERKLPLVIVGTEIYAGSDAIVQGLSMQFGKAAAVYDSVVYFLTTAACENCAEARKTIEVLPSVLALTVDGNLISSQVRVEEINVAQEPEKAVALFERYAVPDDQRVAPSVFLGNTYYSGAESIRGNLLAALQNGDGLGTPTIEDTEVSAATAAALPGAFLAGLTAGCNPCALSMLLMFAGLMINMRRYSLISGLLYLLGKYVVYLGIGFAFSWAWTELAPPWLSIAAKLMMTAAGFAMIGFNIWDALQAHRAQYGKIVNQLPAKMRARLQHRLYGIQNGSGMLIGLSALVIGITVASGEFLCAGQLYAAILIAGARAGAGYRLPLLIYCTAFILPSVVVLLAVLYNRRTLEASDWVLRHMPAIKLITALMMALILMYTWLS